MGDPTNTGNRGKGRKPGVQNKLTVSAKEAFQFAFDGMGGGHGLLRWARKDAENTKHFYTLYARLIPTETKAAVTVEDVTPSQMEKLAAVARAKLFGDSELRPNDAHE